MTFSEACTLSVLRSLAIALTGLCIAIPLTTSLRVHTGRQAMWRWGLALLPVFVPGLLIGYGYRNFALSLVHHPVWNEVLYTVLVMLQVVPVGALVLFCSPAPPVRAAALHVQRLVSRSNNGRGRLVGAWLRHHLFAWLPAWVVMFLLAFQESEVATLMQVDGWTEWLFTRYAAGLTIATALRVLVAPVLLQLAVLIAALWVVTDDGARGNATSGPPSFPSNGHSWLATGYVGLVLLLLVGVPGAVVLRGTWEGFSVLRAHRTLLGEVGIALLFAVTAGGLTWIVSGQLTRIRGRPGSLLIGCSVLPGLMGALALGLGLASLVQKPPLVSLRDSPLPLLIAEVCFLLPRAVLIRLLIGRWRESSAVHTARLLAVAEDRRRQRESAELLWRLDAAGRCGGLLLVCFWAYIELTLPSLLAPPGMTPAPVVLYNLMHYGQISGLSAMLFASMATPVVLVGIAWWGFRLIIRHLHSF